MADLTPQKFTALSNRLTRLEQRTGFQQSPPYPAPAATAEELREALTRLIQSGVFATPVTSPLWLPLGERLFGGTWRVTAEATYVAWRQRDQQAQEGERLEHDPAE